jgi:hypothetical protein
MNRALVLHIHKSAGTAVLDAVKGIPGLCVVDVSYLADAARNGTDVYRRDVLRQASVLVGHHLHQWLWPMAGVLEPVWVTTALRHPWDRAVSLCAHHQRVDPRSRLSRTSFGEYAQLDNPVCRFVLRRFPGWDPVEGSIEHRTVTVLRNFSYVTALDGLADSMAAVSEHLSIPPLPLVSSNTSPVETLVRLQAQAEPHRESFERNHAADLAVYRSVLSDGPIGTGQPVLLHEQKPASRDVLRMKLLIGGVAVRAIWQDTELLRSPSSAIRSVQWLIRNRV